MIVGDESLVGRFKSELELFFGINLPDLKICVLTKDEFSIFRTNDWSVGSFVTSLNTVFIMNESESGYNHEEWLKIIKHELVHLFYAHKYKTMTPSWLFEGLACFLANQEIRIIDFTIQDLMNSDFDQRKDKYSLAYSAVHSLLRGKND